MVISHLVEEHHLSRILFMAGPEHNTDAIERKEAYLETMKKYGLPVTHGMIAQGDYSEFVDKQVEYLLDSNPDAQAIVFANDEMAFAGYRVCEKRGLVVGKDIMITGFDDCERASGMEPPLTTIQQDGELMGKMAVYDLVNRLDGKDPGKEAVRLRLPGVHGVRGHGHAAALAAVSPDADQPGPVRIFGDQQRHHAPGGGAAVYSGKAPGPGQRL